MDSPALKPIYADFAFDDRRLLAVVDAAGAEAARRTGEKPVCRAGCTECGIGPFPITALDGAKPSSPWPWRSRARPEFPLIRPRSDPEDPPTVAREALLGVF